MNPAIEKQVLSLRIIVGAMVAGVIGLSVIAFIVVADQPPTKDDKLATILLAVMGFMALSDLPAYVLVRTTLRTKLRDTVRQHTQTDPLMGVLRVYSTITIIAAAMAESVGLFGGVIYLITGHMLAVAGPIATLVVLFGLFPSVRKVRNLAIDVLGPDKGSSIDG
jgi:hypothetical protein